ncbi:hypothetical protein FRB99_007486 [Tulasnella sp. 403]|nr:hypothetical protein FRB99_007486 [Tulasnella sp. 403]
MENQSGPALVIEINAQNKGKLLSSETVWPGRYEFLLAKGYRLRPRYRPGWKASWLDKPGALPIFSEDWICNDREHILDAERTSDGRPVFIKHIPKDSPEIPIGQYLSSEELRRDPRNHACPLLDVLEDENDQDNVIIVAPLLRPVTSPSPASVKECVEMVGQTLEGLAFLHERKIAHRDCALGNIMMDGRGLFPKGWHPQSPDSFPSGRAMSNTEPSRTAAGGVRYYFIDFGISTRDQEKTLGFDGQIRAPELSSDIPYDPYKLDVYVLGKAYEQLFVTEMRGTEFVKPLIEYMTPQEPEKRPSAAEALSRFQEMKKSLTWRTLTQRTFRLHEPVETRRQKIIADLRYRLSSLWWTIKPNRSPPAFI